MIPDITQFIDIHTHILPGLDDGPKNLEESAAMARCYVDLGISKVVATPHFIPGTAWAAGRERIAEKLLEVEDYFAEEQIELHIFLGMEIAFHKKLINRFEKGVLQPLAESLYYLLEPSFQDSPEDLLYCAKQLQDLGQKVILAHPERIKAFQETPALLIDAVQNGLEVQLNSGSVLGSFGDSCKQTAMHLLASNSVHYLASDAHSAEKRTPLNLDDWAQLAGILGGELLTTLCINNPKNIISKQYAK